MLRVKKTNKNSGLNTSANFLHLVYSLRDGTSVIASNNI